MLIQTGMSYMAGKRRTHNSRDSFLIKIWFLVQSGSRDLMVSEIIWRDESHH